VPNTNTEEKSQALFWGIETGLVAEIQIVVDESGPAPAKPVVAAESSSVKIVRAILESGTGIETRDWDGDTPLIHAAGSGNTEVVRVPILPPGTSRDQLR
jgi:hypothetical protein